MQHPSGAKIYFSEKNDLGMIAPLNIHG